MARVPRPTTKPASVWPIHRLADAAEPRLGKAFLEAFREMRDGLDLDLLGRAYRGNNPHIIWGPAWQVARNTLTRRIQAALEAELNDAAAFALRGMVFLKADVPARAQGAFTIVNRRAVDWAAREAAELVQQVDGETRDAIKALIVQMQRGNLTYQQAARELRQIVGLTTQQAQAVYNFRRKLEARAGLIELMEGERTALTPAQRALIGGRLADTQERIDKLVDRYDARMLRYRTETIARTESMTAANRGQQEAWKAARDMGLLTDPVQRWLVTPDERLCVAAGTMVATPSGDVPIESVVAGDGVLTASGIRYVTAVARTVAGKPSVAVGSLRCSHDHPILVLRGGQIVWAPAATLLVGDAVFRLLECRSEDRSHAVVVNRLLGNTNDRPPTTNEPLVPPGVPLLIAVPVCAVYLKDNPTGWDEKIDAVPPDFGLLYKLHTEVFKLLADRGLKRILATESSVTSKATKAPVCVGGNTPELGATLLADNDIWRTPTPFGTESPFVTLGAKGFSAARAGRIGGLGQPAPSATDSVPVGDLRAYYEFFPASRTCLCDGGSLATSQVAVAGTEAGTIDRTPELLPAVVASLGFVPALGDAVTVHGAVFPAGVAWLSTDEALAVHVSNVTNHLGEWYDLQVAGTPHFVAGGIVVHNCEICAPMEDQTAPLGQPFTNPQTLQQYEGPPAHPACRCALSLVINEDFTEADRELAADIQVTVLPPS